MAAGISLYNKYFDLNKLNTRKKSNSEELYLTRMSNCSYSNNWLTLVQRGMEASAQESQGVRQPIILLIPVYRMTVSQYQTA